MAVMTEQETLLLTENYNYRKKIIESAFQGERVPDSAKEIEAINGVLNSMDKSIYDNVTARLKHQENQNKGAILSLVAESLKEISSQKRKINVKDKITDLSSVELPLDVVEGETELIATKFTLEDIQKEEE